MKIRDAIKVVGVFATVTVLHCDGGTTEPEFKPESPWKVIATFPVSEYCSNITDTWFADAENGWFTAGDRLFYYDGNMWRLIFTPKNESPIQGDEYLESVCGLSRNDVWVDGEPRSNYELLHYDGTKWNKVEVGCPGERVDDIFFSSPNDGWVVITYVSEYDEPCIISFDGQQWETWDSFTDHNIDQLYYFGGGRGWALARDNSAREEYTIRWDGDPKRREDIKIPGLTAVDQVFGVDFTAFDNGWLWGTFYPEGGFLYRYAGEGWKKVECPVPLKWLYNADFAGPNYGWLSGACADGEHPSSWLYDNGQFKNYPWPKDGPIWTVVKVFGKNDAWAVGYGMSKTGKIYVAHFAGFH